MVELASRDRPDVLCLQEVPVWAIPRLERWSGMKAYAAITRPACWPERVSAWVTQLHQGLFRSALAGQANAILVRETHASESLGHAQVSDSGRERRLVHAVRMDGLGVVANLHLTNEFGRPEVPATEAERAREFAENLARPDEAVILAGDFNLLGFSLHGYSPGGAGIDHIFVRGAPFAELTVWPVARRTYAGVVLSDHAPVERTIG